jgi:hypothetical protein
MVSEDDARRAKQKILEMLQGVDPYASAGLTKDEQGEWGVKVNLRTALPQAFEPVDRVDGVSIRFEVTGPVFPR